MEMRDLSSLYNEYTDDDVDFDGSYYMKLQLHVSPDAVLHMKEWNEENNDNVQSVIISDFITKLKKSIEELNKEYEEDSNGTVDNFIDEISIWDEDDNEVVSEKM